MFEEVSALVLTAEILAILFALIAVFGQVHFAKTWRETRKRKGTGEVLRKAWWLTHITGLSIAFSTMVFQEDLFLEVLNHVW